MAWHYFHDVLSNLTGDLRENTAASGVSKQNVCTSFVSSKECQALQSTTKRASLQFVIMQDMHVALMWSN